MTTCSTPGASAQRSAAVARASSASSSTIGQRTSPRASIARSAMRELGEQLGRHPRLGLVARIEVVAERADDPVRGAADVGRALVAEQVEQLLARGPDTPDRGRPPVPRTGGRGAKCARKSSYVASTRWSCTSRASQGCPSGAASGRRAAAISSSARCPSPAARSTAPDRVVEDRRREAERRPRRARSP